MLRVLNKENIRVNRLQSLKILDTKADHRFDRITALAARRFNAPIALITFIDEDRQWFKSRHGVDLQQTSREASICSEVIKDSKVFVVPDCLTNDHFRKIATHPSYLKPLRFYAGKPLTTNDGLNVGTLCIIDYNPNHNFSEQDKADLEVMADMVVKLLEDLENTTMHVIM